MNANLREALIVPSQFIQATRDSGYKDLASALAELIDNAFEAEAGRVQVRFVEETRDGERDVAVMVVDDGIGMALPVLRIALQFGGSTRYNSRESAGRYGMGLPNSSLSQARRVEVFSWTKPNSMWSTYLDVDDVVTKSSTKIPAPRRVDDLPFGMKPKSQHGTVVVWKKCDRLIGRRLRALTSRLNHQLGRVFREQLWNGKAITIDGIPVRPCDPLFLRDGNNLVGSLAYGPSVKYEVNLPTTEGRKGTSAVTVHFVELPIEKWHDLSNEEKRRHGISKGAGVSVLRAGREIDYGWFFMGSKRKENYDDWWRCEVRFAPDLDELFGVTHTKQSINPTETILGILTPDLERIAHELNGRVRSRYLEVKSQLGSTQATRLADRRDHLLEPPKSDPNSASASVNAEIAVGSTGLAGLAYSIMHIPAQQLDFFSTESVKNRLNVVLNELHPFYDRVYAPLLQQKTAESKAFLRSLELVVLAAARAESVFSGKRHSEVIGRYRELWSNSLATFLA